MNDNLCFYFLIKRMDISVIVVIVVIVIISILLIVYFTQFKQSGSFDPQSVYSTPEYDINYDEYQKFITDLREFQMELEEYRDIFGEIYAVMEDEESFKFKVNEYLNKYQPTIVGNMAKPMDKLYEHATLCGVSLDRLIVLIDEFAKANAQIRKFKREHVGHCLDILIEMIDDIDTIADNFSMQNKNFVDTLTEHAFRYEYPERYRKYQNCYA